MKRLFPTILLITFSLLAAFLSGHWPYANQAPQVENAQAAAGAAQFQMVYSSFDFHPSRSDLTFQIDDGKLFSTAIHTNYGYWAALNLPNGATLSEVTFYLVDNDDSANILLTLVEVRPSDNTMHYLLSQSSHSLPSSTNVQSLSFTVNAAVDNGEYGYYLKVESTLANKSHMLSGARVTYTLPTTYLPAVNR